MSTFRGAQVAVLPLHQLKDCFPSQLQKAHPSAWEGREGTPRGATPTPPIPASQLPAKPLFSWCDSSSLPQSPAMALTPKNMLYRAFVPVTCAKTQRQCQPTSGQHWREVGSAGIWLQIFLSWKERSAASTELLSKI